MECQQQDENIGVLGIPQIAMQFIRFHCMSLKSESGAWQPCAKSNSPHIKYIYIYSVNSVTIFLRIKRRCINVRFNAGQFYSSFRVAYGPSILHTMLPSVQVGYTCDGIYGQYQFQTPLSWTAIGI